MVDNDACRGQEDLRLKAQTTEPFFSLSMAVRRYLGMRRVDHIRSAVVEAQIDGLSTVRSLFLYDAVPGGSGYLRQLADNPGAMKAVIESAFQALDTCPCAQEAKTGCYRCVKSYRSQFGPGEPDRPGLGAHRAEMTSMPGIYNIEYDPREEDNLIASKAWVFRPYMAVIGEYLKSLEKYPNPAGVSLTKFKTQ